MQNFIYFWYHLVSMKLQINLRLPQHLKKAAEKYVITHKYKNLQELATEAIREKVMEKNYDENFSDREIELIDSLIDVSIKKSKLVSKEELFKALKWSLTLKQLKSFKVELIEQNPFRFKALHSKLYSRVFRIRLNIGGKETRLIYVVLGSKIILVCLLPRSKEYKNLENYLSKIQT